jgi:putative holliday junction resolvase
VTSARGPVLAIDYGSRRIGLAVSDAEGTFAFPAGFLERRGEPQDLAALRELAVARGVVQIVVGLPIHMDGREGPEALAARAFAAALGRATGLEVRMFDERWTSREAERALAQGGARPGRRRGAAAKGRVDATAAALLLRTWLARSAIGAQGER